MGDVRFCTGIVVNELVVEEVLVVVELLQPVKVTTMARRKIDKKTEINFFIYNSFLSLE
jgi:hypothetical protein